MYLSDRKGDDVMSERARRFGHRFARQAALDNYTMNRITIPYSVTTRGTNLTEPVLLCPLNEMKLKRNGFKTVLKPFRFSFFFVARRTV